MMAIIYYALQPPKRQEISYPIRFRDQRKCQGLMSKADKQSSG